MSENIIELLLFNIKEGIKNLYSVEIGSELIQIQKTKKEFEGDFTIVVFPLLKISKKSPEVTADELGKQLCLQLNYVEKYNAVKGFLNLSISADYWTKFLTQTVAVEKYGFTAHSSGKSILVEYSSPNTNKPLHLGHVRNILLGFSVARIIEANGHKAIKVQIINDRGIHICKSMLAWKKWGNEETPDSSGLKGDKLIGKYYVEFDKQLKLQKSQNDNTDEKNLPLMTEAQEMLRKWEAGDEETISLWKKMNGWVYQGFDATYNGLEVSFDKLYFESETYVLGKEVVNEGIRKGVFYKKEDNSVWCDLTSDGLDEKLLIRADGTSVYITQDIGTAILRFKDFPDSVSQVYVVGSEQEYHFKVLFLILKKLGYAWAELCHHLSYGMIDLPSGKMKSREGTVVDADDIMQEMIDTAKTTTEELGKIDDIPVEQRNNLFRTIGLGALKYFILKVDPKKKMLFNPQESIDFNGNTGPFIQYTYARIQAIIRKSALKESEIKQLQIDNYNPVLPEIEVVKIIYDFPSIIAEAGKQYSPSLIANYAYELVKTYNSFYQSVSVFNAETENAKAFRLLLSYQTGECIKNAMYLLGINVPERM